MAVVGDLGIFDAVQPLLLVLFPLHKGMLHAAGGMGVAEGNFCRSNLPVDHFSRNDNIHVVR